MLRRPRNNLLALLVWLLCSWQTIALAEDAKPGLVFGSVAMDIPAVMHQRLQPLVEYLSDALGQPVQLKLSPDMKSAIQEVASGNVDISYLTPVAYIKANEDGDVRLVAKMVTRGKGFFRLMIVVNENSKIQHLEDLEGVRFAFGDPAALLQRAVVTDAGISLDRFSDVQFLGHYDNIVRAVINDDFDAGILKDTMAYKWQGKGIRVLYESPDLPPYNIVASHNVPAGLLDKVQNAFMQLNDDSPQHRLVIKSLDKKYDGFMLSSDEEYDVVRRMISPFLAVKSEQGPE